MLSSDEIIRTVEMLKSENLDVRTVTLGVSLRDCAGASAEEVCRRIRRKIRSCARDLVSTCEQVAKRLGMDEKALSPQRSP